MSAERRHAQWLNTEFPVFRFEDAVKDPKGVIDVLTSDVDPQDIYRRVFGNSRTYTGRFSRWEEWFGPKTSALWRRCGGIELEEMMGYRNEVKA